MIGTRRREYERNQDCGVVTWRAVKNLTPHPLHARVYGDVSADAELLASVKKNGIITPIIVDDQKSIISGHRRWLAAKELGITHIPALRFDGTALEAEELLIETNRQRSRSAGQIARETAELFRIERELSYERRNATLLQNTPTEVAVMPSCPHEGTSVGNTRDIVASKTGQSKNTVEKQVAIVQKAAAGDETAKAALQQLDANKISTSAAYRMVTNKPEKESSNYEWYTPEKYIEAARIVLGTFDLDPASCEFANKVVKAQVFYTKERDGLQQQWHGKVWMNPPYGDIGPKFVAKLLKEYQVGHVTEAIVLLNANSTETKWFNPLFDHTLCFTDHRLKFYTLDKTGESPANGSAFVYLGRNVALFTEHFRQFGAVVRALPHSIPLMHSLPVTDEPVAA